MLTTSIVNVCVVFNPSVFCIYDEWEWCTAYGTPNWVFVYLNSVIKRVKQCWCTLILLPKSTLNANLTTTNCFFTNDDRQRRRFENFKSDHQYESNLESDVRFEIESNHEASQVPNIEFWNIFSCNAHSLCSKMKESAVNWLNPDVTVFDVWSSCVQWMPWIVSSGIFE